MTESEEFFSRYPGFQGVLVATVDAKRTIASIRRAGLRAKVFDKESRFVLVTGDKYWLMAVIRGEIWMGHSVGIVTPARIICLEPKFV